jgi:hypothetical protein
MTNFKRCSVAMAALLVSSMPALAQDDGMTTSEPDEGMVHTIDGGEVSGDMAGNGFVTFEFDGREVRLPIGIAAQFCKTTASELAQGMRDGIECEITEEEVRQINFPGFTADGMTDGDEDDEDEDMTEEEREERRDMREEEGEMREQERDTRAEDREEQREMRQEERENDKDREEDEGH